MEYKDGTLTALEYSALATDGAYPAAGTGNVDGAGPGPVHLPECAHRDPRGYIDAGPARPFRAPGHPQCAWALEQMMDALAGVALALKFRDDVVEEARIVLSGVAPTPWRSRGVEEFIIGKRLDGETAARASEAAVKEAQPLKHNGYKVTLLRSLIEEELLKIGKA